MSVTLQRTREMCVRCGKNQVLTVTTLVTRTTNEAIILQSIVTLFNTIKKFAPVNPDGSYYASKYITQSRNFRQSVETETDSETSEFYAVLMQVSKENYIGENNTF